MKRSPMTMVPLDYRYKEPEEEVIREILLGGAGPVGLLALRHALAFRRPGLWGDRRRCPQTLMLVREGDGQLEVFADGLSGPVLRWLTQTRAPVALVGLPHWERLLQGFRPGAVVETVETWVPKASLAPASGSIVARRLTDSAEDAARFAATVPPWALRGWGSYEELITHGAAFGVPHKGEGFASAAWVFDQNECYDAVGVYTPPRLRRFGLARAAAGALLSHIQDERGKVPLWSSPSDNTASLALATSFGFAPKVSEALFRCPAQTAPEHELAVRYDQIMKI